MSKSLINKIIVEGAKQILKENKENSENVVSLLKELGILEEASKPNFMGGRGAVSPKSIINKARANVQKSKPKTVKPLSTAKVNPAIDIKPDAIKPEPVHMTNPELEIKPSEGFKTEPISTRRTIDTSPLERYLIGKSKPLNPVESAEYEKMLNDIFEPEYKKYFEWIEKNRRYKPIEKPAGIFKMNDFKEDPHINSKNIARTYKVLKALGAAGLLGGSMNKLNNTIKDKIEDDAPVHDKFGNIVG